MGELTVEYFALLDWKREKMAVVANVTLAVRGLLFSQCCDCFFHGHQASMTVLAREHCVDGWVAWSKDVFASLAVDAIAADYAVMRSLRSVFERQLDLFPDLLYAGHSSPEMRNALWNQLDQLVQKLRPMYTSMPLGTLPAHAANQLSSLALSTVLALTDLKPDVFQSRILVGSCDSFEAGRNCWIDAVHGPGSIGTEVNTSTNLAEVMCGLVDCDWDLVLEEADGEGQACNSTSDDGDVEGLFFSGVAHPDCGTVVGSDLLLWGLSASCSGSIQCIDAIRDIYSLFKV